MIAIDAVLPEIERAVQERTESKVLASMGAQDLRDLIYKIVERQSVAAPNPSSHFAELVATASERHSDMTEAKVHSVGVRHELLKHLLEVIRPALPSLLGAIVVDTVIPRDGHESREHHPLLQGFELINGQKNGPVGARYAISGRSWWIVGLTPEDPTDPVDPRYALVKHFGDVDSDGVGHMWSQVELVMSSEAASQIRDDQFRKILKTLLGRMVALTGTNVPRTTDKLWRVASLLESGLAAMKDSEDT